MKTINLAAVYFACIPQYNISPNHADHFELIYGHTYNTQQSLCRCSVKINPEMPTYAHVGATTQQQEKKHTKPERTDVRSKQPFKSSGFRGWKRAFSETDQAKE